MDQTLIDQIPLVVFIPPLEPEFKASEDPDWTEEPHRVNGKALGNSGGSASLEEEPAIGRPLVTSTTTTPRLPRNWFARIRRRGGKGAAPERTMWSNAQLVSEGDPRFEKSEHPFVVLDKNRAMCYICLGDFVEPKRKETGPLVPAGSSTVSPVEEGDEIQRQPASRYAGLPKEGASTQNNTSQASLEDLEDLGTPGEPLRLLACGHVFH
ncbi:hypothetical protein FRC01_008574, partial [Tulasnella sp. 417]